MKFFINLFAVFVLLGVSLNANAQKLGNCTVINPYPPGEYETFLQTVETVYGTNGTTNFQNIKKIQFADFEKAVNVYINDKMYEVLPDIAIDPDLAADLGQEFEDYEWGNTFIIDFSDEAVAAGRPKGIYKIVIPEGIVRDEEGNTNPEQELTFKVVSTLAPQSVTPANGTYTPSDLSNVQIKFDRKMSINPKHNDLYYMIKNDWTGAQKPINNYSLSADGKTLSFDLSKLLTRGVEFSICLPEGFLMSDDYYINEETWMQYMNWDGMKQATLISCPDENTPFYNIKPFVLTWDYQTIHFAQDPADIELIIGFPDLGAQDGQRIWIPIEPDFISLIHVNADGTWSENPSAAEANGVYIDIAEFINDWAGYQVEIKFPAGMVYNETGSDNPPLNYIFEVRNVWVDPEITTDAGFITLAWPYSSAVTYALSRDEVMLYGENGYQKQLDFRFEDINSSSHINSGNVYIMNVDGGSHGIVIDLNDLKLSNGNYTLIVPQGYLWVQDSYFNEFVMNDEVAINFQWRDGQIVDAANAGVESILDTEEFNAVYDLMGRRIPDPSKLNGLHKGIYIVNGKKVWVK